MRAIWLILVLSLGLLTTQFMFAQESADSTQVVVVTLDGTERIGVILQDDGREILLDTKALGKIYINKSDIKVIRPVEPGEIEVYDGDYRSTGPFTTRYYLTTNALPIKKGEDYAMLHLYGPEVHFATNDRFSVGAMTTWIASPFILALKYNIPTSDEKFNLSLGTLMGSSTYLNSFEGYGGLHWATATIGDRMNNFSLSAGYLYINEGGEEEYPLPGTYYTEDGQYRPDIPFDLVEKDKMIRGPVIGAAGIFKVGKRASFFFDSMLIFAEYQSIEDDINYYGLGFDVIEYAIVTRDIEDKHSIVAFLMPGMRFQKTDDRAFQIALAGININESGENYSFPLPTVAWLFKF